MLKNLFTVAVVSALLGAGAVARADHPEGATTRDVQELQFDLENLDESLQNLDPNDARYQDLQQRVDWLRQDVNRLEQQIRAHRRDENEGLGASQEQVQKLRDDVRALQRDIARSGERWDRDATLPQGTEVQVQLDDALSSARARVEDRVTASVARPVVADGHVVIPAGTRVEGVVERVQPASRPARGGQIDLAFDRLVLDDGRSVPLQSRVVSIGQQRAVDKRSAGIGAILGGVLGEVVGGTKGAIVGVIVGGAGGIAASGGRNVELPAGATLTLRLERPLAMANWTGRQ
jgi:outer membrane murein-binding lipoprotein Lpp